MTADPVTGVWTYTVELCRALAAEGIEIVLAAMGKIPDRGQRSEAAAIRGLTLYACEHRRESMEDPWEDVRRAGLWLQRLAREHKPELIHLNEFAHASLLWDAPVLVTAHSCLLSRLRALGQRDLPAGLSTYRSTVGTALRAADLVVTSTNAARDALAVNYGRLRHTLVIHAGRNPQCFRREAKDGMVLSAGRLWDEADGLTVLDQVAGEVPWPVYVAGDVHAPNGAMVRGSSLQHLGRMEPLELSEWYSRAGVYCHPARYDPFGSSVLEAALSGCALVLSDIPSLRELWDGAAIFVPPGDPAALRSALLDMMLFADQREYLGRRAQRRAQRYTTVAMAASYITAYRALVAQYERQMNDYQVVARTA
jgi:glycogen synthase